MAIHAQDEATPSIACPICRSPAHKVEFSVSVEELV